MPLDVGDNLTVTDADDERILLVDDQGNKHEIHLGEYAKTAWGIGDVTTLFDCTEEEAEAFLITNERSLEDACVSAGWEAMEQLGLLAGLRKHPDEEESE